MYDPAIKHDWTPTCMCGRCLRRKVDSGKVSISGSCPLKRNRNPIEFALSISEWIPKYVAIVGSISRNTAGWCYIIQGPSGIKIGITRHRGNRVTQFPKAWRKMVYSRQSPYASLAESCLKVIYRPYQYDLYNKYGYKWTTEAYRRDAVVASRLFDEIINEIERQSPIDNIWEDQKALMRKHTMLCQKGPRPPWPDSFAWLKAGYGHL